MRVFSIRLSEFFPLLSDDGAELDVFLPYNMTEMRRQDKKRPGLIICPGGGYAMTSQREGEPIARHFLGEGLNVFVLRYSCAPHRFPTQLRELAAAFSFIAQRADEWNVDPSRLAVMGFSAGAHLAAHYSNAFDCSEVREVVARPVAPKASLLCYPVITADERYAHGGSFENLLGHFPLTDEEKNLFSCERLVTCDTPPAFLWHTAADAGVPVKNSLLYAEALSEHGVPFELHVFPFGHHGLATCDEETIDDMSDDIRYDAAWLDSAKKWLKRML